MKKNKNNERCRGFRDHDSRPGDLPGRHHGQRKSNGPGFSIPSSPVQRFQAGRRPTQPGASKAPTPTNRSSEGPRGPQRARLASETIAGQAPQTPAACNQPQTAPGRRSGGVGGFNCTPSEAKKIDRGDAQRRPSALSRAAGTGTSPVRWVAPPTGTNQAAGTRRHRLNGNLIYHHHNKKKTPCVRRRTFATRSWASSFFSSSSCLSKSALLLSLSSCALTLTILNKRGFALGAEEQRSKFKQNKKNNKSQQRKKKK